VKKVLTGGGTAKGRTDHHPEITGAELLVGITRHRKGLLAGKISVNRHIRHGPAKLPGNLFGPRYFTEVALLLLIPASYGFLWLIRKSNTVGKSVVISLQLAVFILLSYTILPALTKSYSKRFWRTDRVVEHFIEDMKIKNSVLFIPPYYAATFLNLMENPPHDRHGNLILLNRERENNYAAAWYIEQGGYDTAFVFDYYPESKNLLLSKELID